jgi:RyR domain-containing protein
MSNSSIEIATVAELCHESNRVYCKSLGDYSQPSWSDAPDWQKDSAINGVKFHILNPDAKVSDSHVSWLKEKAGTGWKYGPVKDAEKKEHPCFVPYEDLPLDQQIKDYIFKGIVDSVRKFVEV